MNGGEEYPFLPRDPSAGPASLAPMLPIRLQAANTVDVLGLVDSAAAINVLPFVAGTQMGLDWEQQTNQVQLTGSLASVEARVVVVTGAVGKFPPVRLAFAWAKADAVPLLLGQVNFFMEFDICLFRSRGVFAVRPKQVP